jgi:hypothetical protein
MTQIYHKGKKNIVVSADGIIADLDKLPINSCKLRIKRGHQGKEPE